MRKVIVIGGGGHARVIVDIIQKGKNYKIYGYTDVIDRGDIMGIPYIGSDIEITNTGIEEVILGIGFINQIAKKKELIAILQNLGLNFPFIVSPSTIINSNVKIGKGTFIGDNCTVNYGVRIGDFCLINTGNIIEHNVNIGDNSIIGPGTIICGDVKIGRDVLIGPGVTINNEITVIDGAIIGAGSIVVKNIEYPDIYIGNPAKMYRS